MRKFCLYNALMLSLFLTSLLTNCQTIGNETWTMIKVLSNGERYDKVMEEVIVRNCGVPETKSTSCSAGTSNDLSVTGGVSIGTGYSVDASVTTGLGIGRESGETIDLETPQEGMAYVYSVAKSYHLISGTLLAQSSLGQQQNVDFNFHASCSIEIMERQVLDCSSAELQDTRFSFVEETVTSIPGVTSDPTQSGVPTITIENGLVLPVSVYINDIYQGQIEQRATKDFQLSATPVMVSFEVNRRMDSFGNPWGEPISGEFFPVVKGDYLLIKNIIGNNFYFYPIFDNNSSKRCEISINNGGGNEVRPGFIDGGTQGVQAGYYLIYSNSTVALFCEGGDYYWGGDGVSEPLYTLMEEKSGVLHFIVP